MKRTEETDWAFGRRRAVQALRDISRDSALGAACLRCGDKQAAWVRRAFKEGRLASKCLGSFGLVNEERPDLPWPAVLFLVADGRSLALLTLYLAPGGDWVSLYQESGDGGPIPIAWGQYCGDPHGPPGVLNGDDADGGPAMRTGPRGGPLDVPGDTGPSSPCTSSPRGAAPPSRARSSGSRRGGRKPKPAAAGSAPSRPSRLELLVELLRRLD